MLQTRLRQNKSRKLVHKKCPGPARGQWPTKDRVQPVQKQQGLRPRDHPTLQQFYLGWGEVCLQRKNSAERLKAKTTAAAQKHCFQIERNTAIHARVFLFFSFLFFFFGVGGGGVLSKLTHNNSAEGLTAKTTALTQRHCFRGCDWLLNVPR